MRTLFIWGLTLCVSAFAFDYDDLRRLIEDRHLATLDSVLPALPAELRQNYTLMRASFSQQGASDGAPRVILFGEDGGLLLAYNGDPAQAGYDTLEAIQFRAASAKYEFHRVRFGKSVAFSETNPAVCAECHTAEYRPNWGQYATWDGAYGGSDDFPSATELPVLQKFFQASASLERYRDLVRLPGSDAAPYETVERGRLRFRPNFRLSGITFAHQADLLAARLSAHPRYREFRALFAMSRLNCPTWLTSPEDGVKKLFGADALAAFPPFEKVGVLNAYAYVLRALGISPREWTTYFVPLQDAKMDPYFFHVGIPRALDLGQANDGVLELSDLVTARLLEKIPSLAAYQKKFRWVEMRFEKDPADHEEASRLDDALRVVDPKVLRGACGDLAKEYESVLSQQVQ